MPDHSCIKCNNQRMNECSIETELRLQIRRLSRKSISHAKTVEIKDNIAGLKERLSNNRAWMKQHLTEVTS